MIKLRLVQPGHPDVEASFEGDSVVLGRDAGCDVVVAEPFVSKNHVQILRGLVIVDLRSRNGTFVGEEKVTRATLLPGGIFNIAGRMDVLVETHGEPRAEVPGGRTLSSVDIGSQIDQVKVLREALESERARAVVLSSELAEVRQREQERAAEGTGEIGALEVENQDLRRRLDTLKEELEGREVDASASLQARLAEQAMKEVQARNAELEARVRQLEAASGGAPAGPDPEVARLRAELVEARKSALPPGEFFAQLNRENQELRERLAHFESGQASPAVPASELFFQLQAENGELRRRLQVLEGSSPARPGAPEGGGKPSGELERLRQALAAAEAELGRLRKAGPSRASVPPIPASVVLSGEGAVLAVARLVVDRDVDRVEPAEVAGAEGFFVLETLRFLRGAERVVTRLAGEMIQLYHLHTMLPNTEGNFRSLTRQLLDDPDNAKARDDLARYLAKLSRWLVIAMGAPRKAALEFAGQLKGELTEEALTEGRPIPGYKKVAGQREAELWRRACEHLKGLSSELIEDRLEKLERHTARVLLGSEEDG